MSEVESREQIPKLIIEEPQFGFEGVSPPIPLSGDDLISVLSGVLKGSDAGAKRAFSAVLRSLVEEGSRFAITPAGQRWAEILTDSPAVERGWLLWSIANVDAALRDAPELPDNPAALLESALQQLAKIDVTKVIADLSRFALQRDAENRTTAPLSP